LALAIALRTCTLLLAVEMAAAPVAVSLVTPEHRHQRQPKFPHASAAAPDLALALHGAAISPQPFNSVVFRQL